MLNGNAIAICNLHAAKYLYPVRTMDMNGIRINRLRELTGKFNTVAEFSRHYGIEPSYISQIVNGHRSFGEKAARKMEKVLNLDAGYFDRIGDHPLDHYKEVFDMSGSDIQKMIINFLDAAKIQLRKNIDSPDKEPGNGTFGGGI